MKDTIRSAFAEVTMPQTCEEQVRNALRQNKKRVITRPNYVRIVAAAACLMAFVLLLGTPTVAEALEKVFHSGLQKYITGNDVEITVEYRSPDGKFTDKTTYRGSIEIAGQGGNNLSVIPEWYVEQDDRVYFAGNGEYIDVTDLISLDTPFTYTYTDQGGIIHYICIGGVYDPDPEIWNVGYAEWFYDPNYVHANGMQGNWIGGYCDNYWNKETDDDWPWLEKAKEEMGIPWK